MTAPGPLEVLAEADRAVREQGRAVLCQVVRAEGSTPGKVGWKLLVRGDRSAFGNLGGGALEAMVVADARELLAAGAAASGTKRYYLTEKALLDYCAERLTNYKRPKYIIFRQELPKTNVGKVLRRELRDDAVRTVQKAA